MIWEDLRGNRVAVWGLGREGQATVRKLAELKVADPILVDDSPESPQTHPTSSGILATADVVIKSPGISRYRPEVAELVAQGIPVLGGLTLWLNATDRTKVVCITGTKGKSTTTAILAHLLSRLGYPATAAGNIGAAPWDPDQDQPAPTYWIIEVSSYQATDLQTAPPVVAVTSLAPDHLDWHGGVEQYYRDKLSLCTRPGADLTIANGDSDLLLLHRSLLGPRVAWVTADIVTDDGEEADPVAWADPLGLIGRHNRRNAKIARRCIAALGIDASDEELREAATGYQGLPSRLSTIGTIDGVTFVDDSLSTNVLPVLAALDAFPWDRMALIAGGHDRGIDYAPLATGIAARNAPTLVLTLPDSGPRIGALLRAEGVETIDCDDVAEAVAKAFAWARPAGVVLLSPAAPSFGRFRDYRDRAAAFAAAMESQRT